MANSSWPHIKEHSKEKHLKVGSQEGISVGGLDHLGHLCTKQVVHDAGALLEDMQPGQQRLHRHSHCKQML